MRHAGSPFQCDGLTHQLDSFAFLWRIPAHIRPDLVCCSGQILPHDCAARFDMRHSFRSTRRKVSCCLQHDESDRSVLRILPGSWEDATEPDEAKETLLWVSTEHWRGPDCPVHAHRIRHTGAFSRSDPPQQALRQAAYAQESRSAARPHHAFLKCHFGSVRQGVRNGTRLSCL